MATKFAVPTKRKDYLLVNPFDVKFDLNDRGRRFPPTAEEVKQRAVSMIEKGQLQPCLGRRLPDNNIKVVAGFTRTEAACLIRKGFEYQGKTYDADPNFMLQIKVSTMNDREALLANIAENNERNVCSPIDDAHNQRRLSEQYGMSDTEIAHEYGYSQSSKVGRLRKLLALSDDEQALVHCGKLSVSGALELLQVDDENKRVEIIEAAKRNNGKVNGAVVTTQVRETILDEEEESQTQQEEDSSAATKRKKSPRSRKEIREYLQSEDGPWTDNEMLKTFIRRLSKYMDGEIKEETMSKSFRELAEALN